MIDDIIALMYAHPRVYVDIGVIVYTQPDFDGYLEELVRNGYGTRILFGSDQMV